MDYDQLKTLHNTNFSLRYLGNDINNKFALISLVCYVTYKGRGKNPNWTCLDTLQTLNSNPDLDDYIKRLAIVCEDFLYGCIEFPLFGLSNKEIPTKIKELLKEMLPF